MVGIYKVNKAKIIFTVRATDKDDVSTVIFFTTSSYAQVVRETKLIGSFKRFRMCPNNVPCQERKFLNLVAQN